MHGLLAHADRRRVQVVQADGRRHLGRHRPGGDHGQLLGRDAHDQLGQQRGELRLEAGLARRHPPGRGHPLGEGVRDVLEGAVLQQPGEEQVAGLDQGEVLLVLRARLRQQPGRLEVQQGRGDEQELRGLAEVPLRSSAPGAALMCAMNSSVTLASAISVMSSLCLLIRPEQQVERAREDVEVHLERRARAAAGDDPARGERRVGRPRALCGRCGSGAVRRPRRAREPGSPAQAAPPRAMSSRASCR